MKKKLEFPIISAVLMVIYLAGGILVMCLPPASPVAWGMDFPTFTIMYGGYAFIILACLYHSKTNR